MSAYLRKHSPSGVYNRADYYVERKDALARWGERIEQLMNNAENSNAPGPSFEAGIKRIAPPAYLTLADQFEREMSEPIPPFTVHYQI